jgi:hypothetical protein
MGALALVALGALSGCGSDAPVNSATGGAGGNGSNSNGGSGGVGGSATATEPLLPWALNNTWTYRVTESGMVSTKTTTIMELTTVGGTGDLKNTPAYFVVTKKGTDQNDKTESYQAPDPTEPDRILRYRELSYGAMTGALQLEEYWVPARIHVDGSKLNMPSFVDSYTEYKLPVGATAPPGAETHDLWVVVSTDEAIDSGGKHYDHSVHLQKTGGSTKDYWYVRGIGKVRETGGQTEELVDYKLGTSINSPNK